MKKYHFFQGKRPAQAMVEFAIALPILLLLLYGILETGRLLFLYSTVVTASRTAVRYGAVTGQGLNGVPRYQDCTGIRQSAQRMGFLGQFDTINLAYDSGPGTTETPYCTSGTTDASLDTTKLEGNRTRLVVTVTDAFTPLVRLVPFLPRNITATSRRTILYSVPIVVDQEEQTWDKTATTLTITSDQPDPSEINQSVTVNVQLLDDGNAGVPNASVEISGADVNCQITTNNNGVGSCNVIFSNPGTMTLTAIYNGDADFLGSSDTDDHVVTLYNTATTILSDQPDFSVTGASVSVTVQVTSTVKATGTVTVTVDEGGSTGCTVTLVNAAGGCTMSFTTSGTKTIRATYVPDLSHEASFDTEAHQVLDPTPTPTATPLPTATPMPTMTPTPMYTPTQTPSPTSVPSCSLVAHGTVNHVGNVMSMTITNPYLFPITMKDVTVTWNHDKGNNSGNKKLYLQSVTVGPTEIWTGDTNNRPLTIPTTAVIPAGTITGPSTITISFVFNQSYDNPETTDEIYITLSTPGCQGNPIDGKYIP
jgi:Flp pilus assembly protein TadG